MNSLENKVALITGGSRGIGEALVKKFISLGASVAFTYASSADRARALVSELDTVKVKAYQSDASSFVQAESLIKQVISDFGKLDILINNAGITKDTLMLRMSEDQWDEVIRVNLKSAFNLTKHALKPMLSAKSGSIINMTSVVGIFGNAGQANYAASKAGMIGFTKSIAKEVGSRSIRCNAIAPGFIETEMTRGLDDKTKDQYFAGLAIKRFGTGNEVAELAAFLASDASKYITGQVISICGGLNM
jgi:3-oxoacyl-[acyl-carrier protein] reductase